MEYKKNGLLYLVCVLRVLHFDIYVTQLAVHHVIHVKIIEHFTELKIYTNIWKLQYIFKIKNIHT